MDIVGVERRAKDARAALNRLHHEIVYVIEQGRPQEAATLDVAEIGGIVTNIMTKLAEALPEHAADELEAVFGPLRERFVAHLDFMTEYHKVPR